MQEREFDMTWRPVTWLLRGLSFWASAVLEYAVNPWLSNIFKRFKPYSAGKGALIKLTKGSIHGIWLTSDGGSLHPFIIPNLAYRVADANSCGFEVVLWTNTDEINEHDIIELRSNGIVVRDHSDCKDSRFYGFFLLFLYRGLQGDKVAFALASDILRMAILELSPSDDCYIYSDPNDIDFADLKASLPVLEDKMLRNSFGFSFYIEPHPSTGKIKFHLRNDVLIAIKQANPGFFRDFFLAYEEHLEKRVNEYFVPETDEQAQALANRISNSISSPDFFFILMSDISRVRTSFGEYCVQISMVNSSAMLPHLRLVDEGNTWLPVGDLAAEHQKIAKDGLSPLNLGDPSLGNYAEGVVDITLYLSVQILKNLERLTARFSGNFEKMPYSFTKQGEIKALPAPPERKMITYPAWEAERQAASRQNINAFFYFSGRGNPVLQDLDCHVALRAPRNDAIMRRVSSSSQ